jgi:hypothetical protein
MRPRTKRRVALSLLAGAAVTGALAVVGAPAYGQSQGAGVGNSGQASAATGGNSSVGNASNNSASTNSAATTPPNNSLVGGLLGLVLNVGATSNTSTGTSTINTGGASASGNNSDTAVSQEGGGSAVVGKVFGVPVALGGSSQGAGVSNTGSANASTGGNRGVGNDSENVATSNQSVAGGLIGIGINLLSPTSNVSDGTSNITTGPAAASGNEAVTTIDQSRAGGGFGAGGGVRCDGSFRFSGQHVDVTNSGSAAASTGNNASVGNQSTNVVTNTQTVGGGLLGLGLNLLSPTSNQSGGTSNINTGAATATGNRSTTQVTQEQCVEPARHALTPPHITPKVHDKEKVFLHDVKVVNELAKTGVDPFVMGLITFSLLFGGFLFMVWERVEAMPRGGVRA